MLQQQYVFVKLEFVHYHPTIGLYFANDSVPNLNVRSCIRGFHKPTTLRTVVPKPIGKFGMWPKLCYVSNRPRMCLAQFLQFGTILTDQNLLIWGNSTQSIHHRLFGVFHCLSTGPAGISVPGPVEFTYCCVPGGAHSHSKIHQTAALTVRSTNNIPSNGAAFFDFDCVSSYGAFLENALFGLSHPGP